MKVPRSFYNWLSITGFILALNALVLIFILFIISLTSRDTNNYLGLYIYIVLPVFLILGLLLIPLGMTIRIRRKEPLPDLSTKWPVFDMNQKKHRVTLTKIFIVTLLFIVVSAIGSFQGYKYTESVEFCGTQCHKVMEPEYTTYQNSPHARVACVECHVGEGADWYVKSKLSGLYQVYSVLFNKFPRPIATPISNLRPARETCERCHWPQKFYARQLRTQTGYLTDSANTEWNISMLMKIGPSNSALGLKEGIHWHINPEVKVEYVSDRKDRESIPWVRLTNLKTGEVKIFEDEEKKLGAKAKDSLETRTMDCMDCHNRPSHSYKSAPVYVDNAMVSGLIPRSLPYIKMAAMEALKNPFTDKDTALTSIRGTVMNYYQTNYPGLYKSSQPQILAAIAGISREYQKNAFPYMHVDASKYLNHIGHLESDGCFRCHSGRHKTSKGEVISRDCDLCHTIIAQGPTGQEKYSNVNESLEFNHPVDIGDAWKTGFCSECHKTPY